MAAATAPFIINNTLPSKSKYRPEIDGMRAFAVIAVIINHFNKDLLPSGYLGVDIFFVISGYVITSSLAGRESKNFLDFLTGFYERRIKRLVPALVVFVLITSILISLFNPDPGVALGLGWRSLFGISNINLYRSSTDYFAESTELNPFTHTTFATNKSYP
jgi:peptidoglycan/LPS O-acetylase OafA/YrhL